MQIKDWKGEVDVVVNCDCAAGMGRLPDNFADLFIYSPPYNVGFKYDAWNDEMPHDLFWGWTENYLKEAFRTLKPGGRMAVNVLYEVNYHDRGGRRFMASEYWQRMKSVGFQWAGLVDLHEDSPHRVKLTAWGSWLRASAPYIYNPKECVLLAFKEKWPRKGNGSLSFTDDKEGKASFEELVGGSWAYRPQTKKLTIANFSLDIPRKALQILSYPGDVVVDPFVGSGQTAIACVEMDRRYIGFEISANYCAVAEKRIAEVNYHHLTAPWLSKCCATIG